VPGGDGGSCGFYEEQLERLIAYLRFQAKLAKTGEDGVSQRDHWEAAAKRGSAAAIAALKAPPFPEDLRQLWGCFQTLSGMRSMGMAGPARISALDIYAANALFGWHLVPVEVEAITRLDIALLSAQAEETRG
jgi:hypothetical protein